MKYSQLNHKNDGYDAGLWAELWELYKGGWYVLNNAGKYLPRVVGENPGTYKERIRTAAYLGYFGPIVNTIVSKLFGQELAVTPAADSKDDATPGDDPNDTPAVDAYYREFAKNVDGKKTTFAELCKKLVRTALVQKIAYLGYDSKKVDPEDIQDRAAEEQAGADKLYAFAIDPCSIIDWETDDDGEYTLLVIHRIFNRRKSLAEGRDKSYEEFKCWIRDDAGVRWELYRTREYGQSDPIQPEEDVSIADQGTVSFDCIPVLPFELPDELWVGNAVAPLNREHFKRRSELIGAEQRSLFEIPVYKLGPEISAADAPMPSEVQQNPNRAKDPRSELMARGFAVIGSDDDIEFKGPTGAAYTIADTQIKELVDEMYRVVSMMAQSISSTTTALHRSGESKSQDGEALTTVLREFGNIVRAFSVKVYDVISEARSDSIVWQAHGLENYDSEIRADLIQEGLSLDLIPIPSKTFHIHHKTSLAFKLVPEMDVATKEIVRQEIIDGVQAEDAIRVSETENDKIIADNGPTDAQLGKEPAGGGGNFGG